MTDIKKEKKIVKKVVKKTEEKAVEKKFAVIKIAGSQLKVFEGQEYDVKKLEGNKGDKLEITDVLLTSDGVEAIIGTPYIEGAKVVLEIASQKKGEKIHGFKYSAKARTRRHFGSRELLTTVLVKKI